MNATKFLPLALAAALLGPQHTIKAQQAMIEERDCQMAEMQAQLIETITRTRKLEA